MEDRPEQEQYVIDPIVAAKSLAPEENRINDAQSVDNYGDKKKGSPGQLSHKARLIRESEAASRKRTRNNLYAVTYGNRLFVAVGDHDTILTSKDGTPWRKRNSGTTDTLFASVAFGNSTFVAVEDSGTILTSDDDARWYPRVAGTSTYLNKVGYENGRFVITAANGVTLVSTNGSAWVPRSSQEDFAASLTGLNQGHHKGRKP